MCPLAASIAQKSEQAAEVYMHHKNGHRIPVAVRVPPLIDETGAVVGGVEQFTDVSAYKSIELRAKELEAMALMDKLTRLANRHCIENELLTRFEEAKRFGRSFGLLMMDIDHFKTFNDS